jgi:hypothetical protein
VVVFFFSLLFFSFFSFLFFSFLFFSLYNKHILQVCYVFVVMFRGHEDIPTLLGP